MIIKSMVPLFSSNKVTKVFIKVITARSPSELGAMQGKNAPDPIFSQRINDMDIGINITKVDYLHLYYCLSCKQATKKHSKSNLYGWTHEWHTCMDVRRYVLIFVY